MTEKVKGSVDRCIAVENMLDDMGRNISKDIYAAVRRATSNVVKGDVRRSG
jgi:predicted lipid carrier protein YhbT